MPDLSPFVLLKSNWEDDITIYTFYRLGVSLPSWVYYLFLHNTSEFSQQRVMSLRVYTNLFLHRPIMLENVELLRRALKQKDMEDVSCDVKLNYVSAE